MQATGEAVSEATDRHHFKLEATFFASSLSYSSKPDVVFILQQVVLDREQISSTHPTRRGHLHFLQAFLVSPLRALLAFSEQRPEMLLTTHQAAPGVRGSGLVSGDGEGLWAEMS